MSRNDIRTLTSRFNEALTGAADLHARQTRKGSDTPYIAHLLGVVSIALEYGADEDAAIAALLHDAVEDAPRELGPDWVRQWIGFRFGAAVLRIVEGCTDTDQRPKPSWTTRKRDYIDRLASEGPATLLVSASDKLHNARSVLSDFRVHGDEVFKRFSPEAGKAGTIGYYRGLVTAFRQRLDTLAGPGVQSLRTLVDELDLVVSTLEKEADMPGVWPPAGAAVRG